MYFEKCSKHHSNDRRQFLSNSFKLALLAVCPCNLLAFEGQFKLDGQICWLWSTVAGQKVSVSSSSGDKTLDRQLAAEANLLSKVFNVRPGLKIADWPNTIANNAVATTDTHVNETKGTVLLGKDLIFRELRENSSGWGGLVVAGFMAHEFAHIYQFYNGYRERLLSGANTAKPNELHADFLAGYHLGLKKRAGEKMDIKAFMDGAYLLGDHNYSSEHHHGKPRERQRAVREGYLIGIKGYKPISLVADMGINKVKAIMNSNFD